MKLGRNDPCSCGSGKKYKNCCMGKTVSRVLAPPPAEVNQLITLLNAGQHADLENRVRPMLDKYPDYGIAWHLLGAALQAQGKDGLPALLKAVALLPDDAAAHTNLGNAQNAAGQTANAAASYRRALAINPNFALAHSNLGQTLTKLGQFEEAVASCQRALMLNPTYAEAYNNLGGALQALGRFAEAESSYRRALEINPGYAVAHNNLGLLLNDLGRSDLAVASCLRARELDPGFDQVHNNLGFLYMAQGQFTEAEACYRRAVEINPGYAEAHNNLGLLLNDLGRFEEAVASCLRARELKHEYAQAHSNLLFIMNYSADHTPAERLEHARVFGRMVTGKVSKPYSEWLCADKPDRLRVGLVSGDLRNHPVGYFLENLLGRIDPARIELIAYPTVNKADELTARIKPHFAAWKPLAGVSDADAAKRIRDDGVHILIDLAGHTQFNRLPVFAWKPAPVQVAWLGYFSTTGVAEIDYLLADPVGVPDNQRDQFSETVWMLPDTRLCFTPPDADLPDAVSAVAPLPALKNGYLTFGCFQQLGKITEAVLATWAQLLNKLPDARLYLQCRQLGDAGTVEQLVQRLRQHGIAPERVTMRGKMPRDAYLNVHAEVDVLLDTFPFTGGTTTCEALWMGVPTLTLAGETMLARQGASLLTAAGLGDWVSTSESDYVAKALALTGDLHRLAALRAGLREQVRQSPLFDAERFARHLEEALWGMWEARRNA